MIEMISNGNYEPDAILCLYLYLHVSKATLLSKRAIYVIISLSTSYVSIIYSDYMFFLMKVISETRRVR
jgi:hypothetical protein